MGDALMNGITEGLKTFATFIPKLLGFLVILLIGWLIAKALSKLVGLVLTKIGLQNILRKAGLDKLTSRINFDVGALIVKLVYYFVLLIVLQYAFSAFGPNPVGDLLNSIVGFLPKVVVAIILVIVAAAIARVVKDLLLTVLTGRPIAPTVGNVVYAVIIALGVIAAANQIGIGTIITGPILIAVLATAGGVVVVGVGGGLIRPAQARWERGLKNLDEQLSTQPARADLDADSTRGPVTGNRQPPQHA
jgi:hypothetical protein